MRARENEGVDAGVFYTYGLSICDFSRALMGSRGLCSGESGLSFALESSDYREILYCQLNIF